jgi:hypothetical protein
MIEGVVPFEDAVPVAVELRRNAESLIDFVHPEHSRPDHAVLGYIRRTIKPRSGARRSVRSAAG